jgi:hypothetical protein
MVFLVFLLIVLVGCTSSVMNGIMSSWEGAHIEEVVSQWGYPHEEKEFNGRKLYVWHHNKSAYMPQSTTTTGHVIGNTIYAHSNTTGGYMMSGNCSRTLEVDDNGRVVNWQWGGNNCPLAELMEYSDWRKR